MQLEDRQTVMQALDKHTKQQDVLEASQQDLEAVQQKNRGLQQLDSRDSSSITMHYAHAQKGRCLTMQYAQKDTGFTKERVLQQLDCRSSPSITTQPACAAKERGFQQLDCRSCPSIAMQPACAEKEIGLKQFCESLVLVLREMTMIQTPLRLLS